jgi:hypothetical protein
MLYSRANHLQGSAPEIVIPLIDPSDCRNHIKENFSIASMAGKYSQLYQSIVDERTLYHA